MLRHFSSTLPKLPLRTQPIAVSNLVRRSYSASKQQPEPIKKDTESSATTSTSTTTSSSTSPAATADPSDPIIKPNDDLVKAVEEEEKPKETYEEREKRLKKAEIGYAFGANHWNLERASAVALVPLISSQFVYGAHPIVDGLLSVVVPYHIYMGFDSCVTDYIPKRVYPRGYKAAMWSLKASMALTIWGCYEFNTNDVGLTEAIQRIWTA